MVLDFAVLLESEWVYRFPPSIEGARMHVGALIKRRPSGGEFTFSVKRTWARGGKV